MARNRKGKRGSERFVMLEHWIMRTPAYVSLSVGAKALLFELLKVYNGHNNGMIFLSVRDAAARLGVNKGTPSKYFRDLEIKGFISKTRGHTLGLDGKGEATHYALTMREIGGAKPTHDFKVWRAEENQMPVRKIRNLRPENPYKLSPSDAYDEPKYGKPVHTLAA